MRKNVSHDCYFAVTLIDYKYFRNLWEDNPGVKPILSSLKCTLHLTLTVHQWVDVFLSIAQSERLEQIMVDGDIIEVHLHLMLYHTQIYSAVEPTKEETG